MFRLALALTALLALAAPATAQEIRLRLSDGSTVTGELEDVSDRAYRVLVDGKVVEYEASRVLEVSYPQGKTLATLAPIDSRIEVDPEASIQTLEAREDAAGNSPEDTARRTALLASGKATEAHARGEHEAALVNLARAMKQPTASPGDLAALAGKVHDAYADSILNAPDTAPLERALRVLPTIDVPSIRDSLFTLIADEVIRRVDERPDDPSTPRFAAAVARGADPRSIPDDRRKKVADALARAADLATGLADGNTIADLRAGVLKFDPRRPGADQARDAALLAAGRERLADGQTAAALEAARAILSRNADQPDALRLKEDAGFALLRERVTREPHTAEVRLERYLAVASRPEHRAWATAELARLRSAAATAQAPDRNRGIHRYFPARPGTIYTYRRRGSDSVVRLRIAEVQSVGGITRIRFAQDERLSGGLLSNSHVMEIEKNAVYRTTGTDRQPVLRYPAARGETWAWSVNGQSYRRTITATGETVSLPGPPVRTYEDCVVVEFTSTLENDPAATPFTTRSTYAPDVGLIRLEYLDSRYRRNSLDLVSVSTR